MDRRTGADAFAPAVAEALRSFPVQPGELRAVSLSENVTYRVRDARDGRLYVLRLHRPWYHTLEELESERVWIRALDASTSSQGREYCMSKCPCGGVVRAFSEAEPPWPAEKIPWSEYNHSKIPFRTLAQELDFPQNVQSDCL